MSAVRDRVANLAPADRRALLAQLLQKKARGSDGTHPLSYGQQALWFLHQLAPDSVAYNDAFAWRIESGVDAPALRRTFQSLVDRHATLRTTFASRDGKPVQRVRDKIQVHFEQADASSWSDEAMNRRLVEEAHRPFDLERGPLFRVHLYTRSARSHVLLLTVHHIVGDFWSLAIIADELRALYPAELSGTPPALPALPVQYAEHVRRQSSMLAGPEGERHWAYWRKQLAGDLPALKLPTDRPRPPAQTYHGASHTFSLSGTLTASLKSLARSEGTTLFTVLLAAFQVLLYRCTGQEDILVGSPSLGRDRADLASLVGYLVNPLVLRASLSGSTTFKTFLGQVRRTVLDALEHAEFPFPLLVERLQPKRDPSRSPLFQVMFSLQMTPSAVDKSLAASVLGEAGAPMNLGGLPMQPIALEQRIAQFDLVMMLAEAGGRLGASIQYSTDLFEADTITRMAGHYATLLTGIASNPEERLSELPLLTEAERSRLLVTWNDTRADYPSESCAHELFEAQADRTPDAVALAFQAEQLTYRELNRRANQVARYLVDLRVGPDTLVGLCVERSVAMVVGLLGILKAGGAYVPLDPAYPADRLAYILSDSAAPVLLTQTRIAAALPPTSAKTVCLDSEWEAIAQAADANPLRRATPDDLAYVLYTSGSTGTPKGVMVEHRSLVNYLHWCVQAYSAAQGSGAPVHSTLAFDLTVTSLFSPLLAGKTVTLLPEADGIGALGAALRAGRDYSLVKITPAHLELLPQQLPADLAAGSTRALVVGGEALFAEHLSFWRAHAPRARLINEYGPTETVVGCCVYEIPEGAAVSGAVPIGRPIANTQLYVLDANRQPLPIGVPGELYVGGLGVARGYLNRPTLTAEKFIPDPFSSRPGARLYKTGDTVRYRPDGSLEFLGRLDDQLKIRGFRVEPGEIEAALTRHPAVREAAVVAREAERGGGPPEKRLVAYVVADPNAVLAVDELRCFLKQALPDYMIPGAIVFLDTLPLTPHGKVNRRALPAPESARPNLGQAYAGPRNELEKTLADVCAQVLGLDKVGIDDNFFDLGGSSIQSLEVVARASAAGVRLTAEMLFEHQTVAELAAGIGAVEPATAGDTPREVTASEAAGTIEPVDAAPSGRGNVVIESLGVFLPPKVVSTADVLKGCTRRLVFPLERFTGIRSRRMAGEDEFSIDLAERAVDDCLANSGYTPQDIDLLICCNISRYDGPNFRFSFEPSTSLRLKQRFGFDQALAFDITNACAGMFTAIDITDAFIKAGLIRRALVVSGEYISHLTGTAQKEIRGFMDPRLACLTLGDAGAAIILERAPNDESGFHEIDMYTLGKYSSLCIAKATDQAHGGAIMLTDSIKSSAIAIKQAVLSSARVLRRSGRPAEGFQHVIMHQTSETALRGAVHEINRFYGKKICHEGNTIYGVAERGNTASTSHFVALMDNILNDRIRSGDNVVFGISGSGQTVGTALYTFDDLPDRLRRTKRGNGRPSKTTTGRRVAPARPACATRVRIDSIGTIADGLPVKRDTVALAKLAAEDCLRHSSHDPSDLSLIMFAGVYRNDFLCEPAVAALLAGELGINADARSPDDKRTFVFDVFNGALGFLNACHVAVQMIRVGKHKNVMVVASEIENNAALRPERLLGIKEIGSAIILEEATDGRSGFGNFVFRYDTRHMNAFVSHAGQDPQVGRACLYFEKDPDIATHYLQCIPDAVAELLAVEGLGLGRITAVFPPQMSPSFVPALSERMGVPRARFVDLADDGKDLYTSSAAYALRHALEQKRVGPGDVGLIIGVGSGVQVGCAVYYF